MKILYLVNGIRGGGGLERVLVQKASFLAERYDHSVRILVFNELRGRPFYPVGSTVEIAHFRAAGRYIGYLNGYIRGLRRALSDFQPDILAICDDGMKAVLLPVLLPRKRPPLVYERHASIRLSTSWWKRWIMRKLVPGFDRVIALTSAGGLEWPGARVEVIPNALPRFPPGDAGVRQSHILCVGSLSRNKGYDLLIDAWSRIAVRHPDWSVHIYGKGAPSPYVAQARALGVEGSVNFHPPVTEIESKYRQASMLVLPSRSEGFGMVLIEAMSCGLPCIAFDCPSGPGDILTDGVDGVLVPPEDVSALADAMERLIENPVLRGGLGAAARRSASRYDIEEIGARWHAVFTSMVADNVA